MSGVTKKIFEKRMIEINKKLNQEIKQISIILPKEYNYETILKNLKLYFPYEWKSIEYEYDYYYIKDKSLLSLKNKSRYNMPKPETILQNNFMFKKITSTKYIEIYKNNFSEKVRHENEVTLKQERTPKINKIDLKIAKALENTQKITPIYIDKLIGAYERKSTEFVDKVYILNELTKYYDYKIIRFFYKVCDVELNKQLRYTAFKHLQSFNYNPRLRSQKYMQIHTKNKNKIQYLKNVYPNLKYKIQNTPDELLIRTKLGIEENIKNFDYFICHSSIDKIDVRNLIKYENENNKNIFCDWLNDVDFLNRELLCKATLRVLEERMQKSQQLIFVKSNNSLNSNWCKYELNYFYRLNKPIFIINIEDLHNKLFTFKESKDNSWYYDTNFQNISLINISLGEK